MRLLLILPLLAFACREKTARLAAAHDTAETAYSLAADRPVTGQLVIGENRVYFRVHLAEPGMFRAELSAVRGADTRLEILNARAELLHAADDHGSSLAEEIYPVFLAAGDYLLRVSADAAQAEWFTFFYRLFKAPADVEREPNNSPETATVVAATHASGFHGAEFFWQAREKSREQDCFRFAAVSESRAQAVFTLTGVDGFAAALQVFDPAGDVLVAGESEKPGQLTVVGPVAVPADRVFTVCVRAMRRQANASRDYYDLEMRLANVQLRSESEPNNSRETAAEIAADSMQGSLSSTSDTDYFYWQNRRDYPVILRVDLTGAVPQLLRLEASTGQGLRTFEGSAERGEVADNLRVEAAERVLLLVRCSGRCNRRTFRPVSYRLGLDESQATDENETEPNDSPERAETLVDLTQKWGFMNPRGDIDCFRLSVAQPTVRDVLVEAKLGCRLRLEHVRSGKSLAISTGKGRILYNAEFAKDDILRLTCIDAALSADRSYRLSVNEP